jgi:hypothetical protein
MGGGKELGDTSPIRGSLHQINRHPHDPNKKGGRPKETYHTKAYWLKGNWTTLKIYVSNTTKIFGWPNDDVL